MLACFLFYIAALATGVASHGAAAGDIWPELVARQDPCAGNDGVVCCQANANDLCAQSVSRGDFIFILLFSPIVFCKIGRNEKGLLLTFAFLLLLLLLLPLYSAKLKAKNSIAAIATLDACANEGFGKRQKRGIVSTLVALKVKSVLGVGGGGQEGCCVDLEERRTQGEKEDVRKKDSDSYGRGPVFVYISFLEELCSPSPP